MPAIFSDVDREMMQECADAIGACEIVTIPLFTEFRFWENPDTVPYWMRKEWPDSVQTVAGTIRMCLENPRYYIYGDDSACDLFSDGNHADI